MLNSANPPDSAGLVRDPSAPSVALAAILSLIFVVATRWPVARVTAFDFDEVGYLKMIAEADFPKHHTLFLAAGKAIGRRSGDPYRGFVVLDMTVSALGADGRLVDAPRDRPAPTAAAASLALGVGPVFWSYGAMAANYTAIVLVGAVLLGIVARMRSAPRPAHPYLGGRGAGDRHRLPPGYRPVLAAGLPGDRVAMPMGGGRPGDS